MTEAISKFRTSGYELPALPLWRGVQASPGIETVFPFRLGWDSSGFVHQTTPDSVRKEVVAEYADPSYQYMTTPPGGSAWANRLGDMYVATIKDLAGDLNGARILEIGAGSTYIAERLLNECSVAEYVIVDPAVSADAGGVNEALEIVPDYYPSAKVGQRSFDVVVALNCLEHVEDPTDFLASIRCALRDENARAVLVFPDVTEQFVRGDLNVLLHEHLNYFDGEGTAQVFASAGLTPVKRFSEIDTWFVLAAKAGPAVASEQAPGPDLLGTAAHLFEEIVEREGDAVRKRLDSGGTVLFHGAVNGLNTFFYLTGLGQHPNIRLVDGDDTKAGRYLPACEQAIALPAAEIYAEVDVIYVSAATFFDEIRQDLVTRFGVPAEKIRSLFQAPETRPDS